MSEIKQTYQVLVAVDKSTYNALVEIKSKETKKNGRNVSLAALGREAFKDFVDSFKQNKVDNKAVEVSQAVE